MYLLIYKIKAKEGNYANNANKQIQKKEQTNK